MLKNEQFEVYGKVLDGLETEFELAKDARKRYLKLKMRERLSHEIGDDPDALTDVLRAALIGYAVSAGIVKDAAVIARLNAYVSEMVEGYGGAEYIMDVLEYDKMAVGKHVLAGFFVAKAAIDAAKTMDEVRMVDLPGEPGGV